MLVQIDEEIFPRDMLRYISRSLVNLFPGSDLYFRQLFLLFDEGDVIKYLAVLSLIPMAPPMRSAWTPRAAY